MGLLDTWQEWKDRYDQTGKTDRGTLATAGGIEPTKWETRKTYPKEKGYYAKQQKLLEDKYRTIPVAGGKVDMTIDRKTQNIAGASLPFQTPPRATLDAAKVPTNTVYQDAIMKGGKGANMPTDLNWWQKLSGMFNSKFDLEGAKASWTKKGGFEGLMANPAFTMGLAFMQSAAEGKSIGQGALDNVIKAGGISHTYKKIIEDRKLEPIQATGGDIAEVKDMLKSINIEKGNWFENFLGGQQSGAKWEAAVEEIALEFQKEIREKQTSLLEAGKSQVIKRTDQLKILERLVSSNKIKKKGSILSYLGITAYTLKDISGTKGFDNKAQGGPVAEGQPYVVGEGGPEYFLPKESGKVLSNDDTRIFAMLLTANPQLQSVSRTRAEKILRNRFPEYFE